MKKTICPICEGEITEEEAENLGMPIDRGECQKDNCIAHDTCYSDDLNEPIATILHFKDGEKYQTIVGNYAMSIEDYPMIDHESRGLIQDYARSIKWISTDAWRGFYEGQTPKGWLKMVDSWFCGFDGHNLSEEDYTAQLEQQIGKNEIPPVELLVVFARTSNVFSTGLEVFVKPEDKNKLVNWLKETK